MPSNQISLYFKYIIMNLSLSFEKMVFQIDFRSRDKLMLDWKIMIKIDHQFFEIMKTKSNDSLRSYIENFSYFIT